MGIHKKKKFSRDKKSKKYVDKSENDEPVNVDAAENTYDIEASDEEDEAPPKWYDQIQHSKLQKVNIDASAAETLFHEAEMVLEQETNNYRKAVEETKKSDRNWMMTMARSGTSTDKVAALTLMVQESPVHNIASLSALVNMAKTSKKHQFMAVLDNLTELFISDLLRPGKKLKVFSKQPLAHLNALSGDDNSIRRKYLCYWLFEDTLKKLFATYVSLLNTAAADSISANREKAIGVMIKLIQSNREQEDVLVNNLINKFGDTVHKVASRVVYGLEKVIQQFPKMKEKMLNEVERMLFRTNIAKRCQYYGICFLSQFKFQSGDKELAKRMIQLYFAFFKACVKTGDIESKLMGALLVGVNRAYPFASRGGKDDTIIPKEYIDTMYEIVAYSPYKIGLQALSLLFQISNNDRYYSTLYRKIQDKELLNTSHQAIWLNLMIKAIRKDEKEDRKKSFIKRILETCLNFKVPLLCATLMMISQIVKQMENTDDNFKFINPEEIKTEPDVVDVVSNLDKFDGDADDDRVFDVVLEEDLPNSNSNEVEEESRAESKPNIVSSWVHKDLLAPKTDIVVAEKKFKPKTMYDRMARNPLYAGGEKAPFVELVALAKHYHPTVSLFATKIIAGEKINYTGDPLKDFTLLHFLERFAFKNPKKNRFDKGEDKQELFRAVGSQRSHYNPTGMRALPVQSDHYLKQSESAVPVDEMFLYKYLKGKLSKVQKLKNNKNNNTSDDDLSDAESVGSIEFDDYMDNLMTGKKDADSLDFADGIDSSKKKQTKDIDEDDDSNDDDEEMTDDGSDDDDGNAEELESHGGSDEEVDGEDDEEESGNDDGDAEEEGNMSLDELSDDEDINMEEIPESEEDEDEGKMSFQAALKKRIARDFSGANGMMSMDSFSQVLEDAGRTKSGGTHDTLNKDNSSAKQIRWEASRVKGRWRNQPQNKKIIKKKNFNAAKKNGNFNPHKKHGNQNNKFGKNVNKKKRF